MHHFVFQREGECCAVGWERPKSCLMSYEALKTRLDAGHVIIVDGITGTELQSRGMLMAPCLLRSPILGNDRLLSENHPLIVLHGSVPISVNRSARRR
jgi:hypothetical protein